MTIYRDGTGCMFFTGNWKEFALCYKLEQGFLLTFRHRQGTYNFVVRVFDGLACRRFYHPVRSSRRAHGLPAAVDLVGLGCGPFLEYAVWLVDVPEHLN
jgi:hypothetical protein